jgi:hypothetical protein
LQRLHPFRARSESAAAPPAPDADVAAMYPVRGRTG